MALRRLAKHRDEEDGAIRLWPCQHLLGMAAPVLVGLQMVRTPADVRQVLSPEPLELARDRAAGWAGMPRT